MRILIADNHTLFSEGLRSLASQQADFEVVGEARNGRDALVQTRELCPDVVLMDVVMPELNGLEATRQIRQESPGTRVLALSMHIDKRYVLGMLEAGATGYLAKEAPFEEVARALRVVASGQVYLAPSIAGVVVEGVTRRPPVAASTGPELSQREREVLQLLAEGKSARAISRQLHISIKTVETHRRNMLKKLGLDNVAELVRYALKEGITSLDEIGTRR
ncbi:MAG: response regulator transcription factor [Deltaproteobacteria bacterium]|nr:response regulator transcription factor [Deltaproteobacteria bacterium]MCW5803876.1 response regulator transcription factor [Deltaproteobacteria bacterium]